MQRQPSGLQELIDRINELVVWTRGGKRAPHKPLLLLLALAKAAAGEARLLGFNEVEQPLRHLLDEYGTSKRPQNPEYPFWYLQTDGLWQMDDETPLRRRKKGGNALGNPVVTELRRQNTRAGLPAELYEAARADPEFARRLADVILLRHFPVNLHAEILEFVGFKSGKQTIASPAAANSDLESLVLAAYRHSCAFCGFSARLGAKSFGVEATSIRWLHAGGKASVDNALALCLLHRQAFDRGGCGVDARGRLILSAALTCDETSQNWFSPLIGSNLRQPGKQALRPRPENLAWHLEEVFRWPSAEVHAKAPAHKLGHL